jgi:hypothetical protein
LCSTLHFLRLIRKGNILSKTRVLHDSCDENTVISFLLKTLRWTYSSSNKLFQVGNRWL